MTLRRIILAGFLAIVSVGLLAGFHRPTTSRPEATTGGAVATKIKLPSPHTTTARPILRVAKPGV